MRRQTEQVSRGKLYPDNRVDRPHRRAGLIGVVVAAMTLSGLAGCTKAPPPATVPTSSVSSVTATSESTPAPSTTPTTSVTASVSSTPTRTPSPSVTRSATPTASSTVDKTQCQNSQLKIAALRGSGAAGHQFASLQFTNISAGPCSIAGYPGVQLLAGGRPLGQPAARSGAPVTKLLLKTGQSASSQLTNDSTCNAANSDSVQVIAPDQTAKVVLHLSLRGCPLTVGPVTAS
ncbi:MAG: hypothetical protein JWN95_2133 [Frankiales bacterium]|nr:hypothetical protein [Frankiales bacterium]